MNFSECFANAANGDKNSYAKLYSFIYKELFLLAYYGVKPEDVAGAVTSAAKELMSTLEKCDENSFRPRAAKLMCMRIIPLFKKYRDSNEKISYNEGLVIPDKNGIDIKQELNRLTDLERLAILLWTEFSFSENQISLVSGQKEAVMTEKLASAQKKIYAVIGGFIDVKYSLRENLKNYLSREIPLYAQPEILFPAVETKPQNDEFVLDAKTFIKAVKAEKLTGKEFLQLLGNSRINNSAYAEIEQNPQLTFNRLVELLENSPLEASDYEKLLLAAKKRTLAKNTAENADESKLNEERAEKEKALAKAMEENQRRQAEMRRLEAEEAERARIEAEKAEKARLEAEKIKQSEQEIVTSADETTEFILEKTIQVSLPEGASLEDFKNQDSAEEETAEENVTDDETDSKNYKGADYFDDDTEYYEGRNRPQIIACFVLAVILGALSFGLRYFYTGSFLLTDNETAVVEEVTDESGIYKAIEKLSAQPPAAEKQTTEYYTSISAETSAVLSDTVSVGNSIYTCHDGLLYMVDTVSGKMSSTKNTKLPEGFMGMFVNGDRIAVVSEQSNIREIAQYWVEQADEAGNINTVTMNAELSWNRITIDFYSSKTLKKEYTYAQNGKLCDIINGENVYLITSYNIDNAIADANETFIPSYYTDDEKHTLTVNDIIIPQNAECKAYTILGSIDSDLQADCTAILGGSDTTCILNNYLYLLMSGTKTDIVRLANDNGEIILNAEAIADGIITIKNPFDSRNGIIRLVTSTTENTKISIFDEELNLLSGVDEIASEKICKGAAFDDRNVYIIADSEQIYGFDTGDFTSPAALDTISASIYTSETAAYGNQAVGITAVPDADGNRTSLKLTMYSDVLSELYSTIITADSTVDGDWNKYLSSDAETDISAVYTNSDKRLVIVPIKYFDGISEIEKFLIYNCSDTDGFTAVGEVVLYDVNSSRHDAMLIGDTVYTVWDDRIISMSTSTYTVVETHFLGKQPQVEITTAVTEETSSETTSE